ncbi:hypothetical protein [Mycolicibacterium mengxianglii]|uniref:hypothetical protein n=1 Tax=Mycolicibacterium mengxianglii TaxID=2736649 RepID=UPI0018EEFE4F|nr:hypothetical protein [Mycolicibacterium mengxianglii]
MDIAIRSYLTAGVAVVGATAITLAPIEVLPADLQIRGDRMVAVLEDVSLSSLADLIAATQKALSPVGRGAEEGAVAAGNAIRNVGAALSQTVAQGVAGGGTAFHAVVDGLRAQGSSLATAVDTAIAAFPTPQAFLDALVAAIASVDLNLSLALDVALQAVIDLGITANAAAIAQALLDAGAPLIAAFNAAVAAFPTPAEFATALATALSGVLPGLSNLVTDGGEALANLITTLATTLASGIDLGGAAFDVLLAALQNGGSALAQAFAAAIASFANPQAFVDAFVAVIGTVSAPLAAALQIALNVALSFGFDFDVAAIVQALLTTGGDLAAILQLVIDGFPTPGDVIAAFGQALASILPGFQNLANFAAQAVANLSAALVNAIQDGIAFGSTVFEAIVDGLQNAGSQLYAAFAAAIAAFPTPAEFLDAFVGAFTAISAPLGAALELAFDALRAGLEIINPAAIAQALINAGAGLVDLFQSVVESFPTPAELAAALGSALAAVIPGFRALAAAGVAAISNLSAALLSAIESGIALGGTAFQAIVDGLLDAGGALAAALAAAIAAFPTPQAFIDAFVSAFAAISAPLGAALELAFDTVLAGLEIINPAAIAQALINAGAGLVDLFESVVESFPTPAELVAAFSDAISAFIPGVAAIAAAASAAISNLAAELADVIEAGLGFGGMAFEAIVNGIQTVSGDLAAAFRAVLELFPSPQQFVQALVNAFGEIGPVLANLGTALVNGIETGIELGGQALAALGNISAEIGARLTASLSAALEALPTPTEVIAAAGTLGQSVVDAAGYVGATIGTAVEQFTNVATAVAVAFRNTTAAALANGQNALEALVKGITAAAAQLAGGFGAGVDVDVDVNAGAGTSALDVAGTRGIGLGKMFSITTPGSVAPKADTAETATATPVVEGSAPAAPVTTEKPVVGSPVTAPVGVADPAKTVLDDAKAGFDNLGKQINDGLNQTRTQIESGLAGVRDNVEKALGVKKPATDSDSTDSGKGGTGEKSEDKGKTSDSSDKSDKTEKSDAKTEKKSEAKSDTKSEAKTDKKSSSDSGDK